MGNGSPEIILNFDVAIIGGGLGACAAAVSIQDSGLKAVLVEATDWIGGQLTSQIVPPDEHPWIESFGCTASYRDYRNRVREFYRTHRNLTKSARRDRFLNPGQGWVSRLCHEPEIGKCVLESMLEPAVSKGELSIILRSIPVAAEVDGGLVRSITIRNLDTGNLTVIEAQVFLDATELGDLLPLTGTAYRIGSESIAQTGEAHATEHAEPDNVQGITWCFAMGYDPIGEHVIDKPAQYEHWKSFAPDFWVGPLLSWNTVHAHTMQPFTWTMFKHEHERNMALFDYRQIVSKDVLGAGAEEATIMNWPQNDYFEATTLDVSPKTLEERFADAKQLSLSLLYWLQTEAPRPDGGTGYPGCRLRPDLTGTADGFAKYPYIREARRIESRFTVLEQHVSAHDNPGKTIADPFWDSVGIGAYRIDLHPSTNGRNTVDFSSLPFQIPLGSLIPIETKNLIPACKNLGVTHITNGCYRLHPVEWNIGEVAGALAVRCIQNRTSPAGLYESRDEVRQFQAELRNRGVELEWPQLRAL
jgi:hypothetical protein